jgi:DNA mismatch endonuclease (patch repair protein)
MSRVKSKDTKPEIQVRKYLHAAGFRYTLLGKYKGKKLPGKPDLTLPAYKTVVFVHGCFWHAHKGCKYFKIPETRRDFWTNKLFGNRERDLKNENELKERGWRVFVVWTCELKTKELAEETLLRLEEKLSSLRPK